MQVRTHSFWTRNIQAINKQIFNTTSSFDRYPIELRNARTELREMHD